jgi:hypothetical protein
VACGVDATDDLMEIRSKTAKAMLEDFHIGHFKTNIFSGYFVHLSHLFNTHITDQCSVDPLSLEAKLFHPFL